MELRDYQRECIDKIFLGMDKYKKQIICLPTGAGKTIVFSHFLKEFFSKNPNSKALILAHRHELLTQAHGKLKKVWADANVGYVHGKLNQFSKDVIITSIQTYTARKEEFKKYFFNVCVVDETHHITSKTYMDCMNEMGFLDSKDKFLLGVTATPKRTDKIGLKNVFDVMSYKLSIGYLIDKGYLVPVKVHNIISSTDIKSIKLNKFGDYDEKELESACNTDSRNNLILNIFRELLFDKKTLIFAISIQHAIDIHKLFIAEDINCEVLHGNIPKKERKKILKKFAEGQIKVLINCMILTEGFDEPSIESIIMARPTRSQTLYIQVIGRGLRLYEGKSHLELIEITDNDYKLITSTSIEGLPILQYKEKKEKEDDGEKEEAKKPFDYRERDRACKGSGSLFSEYMYDKTDYGYQLKIPSIIDIQLHKNEFRKYTIIINGKKSKAAYALEYSFELVQNYMKKQGLHQTLRYDPTDEPLSQKQHFWLKKYGIPTKGVTKRQAKLILSKLFNKN